MQALGRQILVEFYDCDEDVFADEVAFRQHMLDAVAASGATVVSDTFHHFSPFGVSGVVVIAESHVTIHTWPEYRYAAVDIFTCGETINPWIIQKLLSQWFRSANTSCMELKRGLFPTACPPVAAAANSQEETTDVNRD
jgi:S-adenosylmethionine decarboxylase proenzyme